jgi:hypothetical protein
LPGPLRPRAIRLKEFSYLNGGLQPKSYFEGLTALAKNDHDTAQRQFALALPIFEKDLEQGADSANRHANLGLLYAFMGKHDDALREGPLAVELKPLSKDATDGAIMLCYLA